MLQQRYASHPLIYPNTVEERLYQRSIARTALDRNTLVILPTALGKTVISALVVAETLFKYRDTRVLVMAPTRPLVMQHKRSFQSMIRLPEEQFVLLTGKTPAEFRSSVWSGSSRLIFATPQVVRNDLIQNRLNLKGFGLLVFDECHRSVKEYAYTEVAESYVKTSPYPLILGMTASPGSDLDRVMMVCESLSIEHVEHRSDEDPDVKRYINPVTVEWKKTNLPPEYQPVREILQGMLKERIRTLQSRSLLKRNANFTSRMNLIELGSELRYRAEMSMEEERGPIYAAISLQAQALTLFHMLELLDTQGAHTLKCFMERLDGDDKRSHAAILREAAYGSLRDLLEGECYKEHPKLDELKTIASHQLGSNPKSRMLAFTQYRDTASHLVEELNKVEGVRAERFVGQASKINDKGLTQDQQASLIEDLRKGYINTLCATSIAEEGLDIPEVDMVIFYEPIPSEIRYIQRSGRTGRRAAGRVIILTAEGTNDMVYLYASQRRTERMKSISGTLNQKLKPILTSRVRPNPNPMTQEELHWLENSLTKPEVTLRAQDHEKVRGFDRMVGRAEQAVYMRILESGIAGLDDEQLYSEMEEEGYPRNTVKAALQRLVKKQHFSDSKNGRAALAVKSIPDARLMEIEVEKILPGEAVVIVDGKWHARLEPANYNGPRQLIKRNTSFKALCELYHSEGVLYVKVRQVVEARG